MTMINKNFRIIAAASRRRRRVLAFSESSRSGTVTQITDDGSVAYYRPQWYPDGNQLVLHSKKTSSSGSTLAIWKINTGGDGLTQITFPDTGKIHAFPAVSHDGTKIVYHSNEEGSHNIWTIDVNGSNPNQLTIDDAVLDVDAAWSPDDNKIVFRSSRDTYSAAHPTNPLGLGNPEIYVMDAADGGTPTRITNDDHKNYRPSFSPDGNKIIFDRELTPDDGNGSDVWIMDYPSGLNQTRLTESVGKDFQPTISPDGTKIVWVSDRPADDGGVTEIYIMNIDGTGVTRMTANEDTDYQVAWSPDGTQIAFSSNRDNNFDIFIMEVS